MRSIDSMIKNYLCMKKMKYFILFIVVILLHSCQKDDSNEPKADYSVLGIKSVTLNEEKIPVNKNVFLDLTNTRFIVINRVEDQLSQKQIQINYGVMTEPKTPLTIQIESSYADVSAVINVEEKTNYTDYRLIITRPGHKEQVIYVFQCFSLKSPS